MTSPISYFLALSITHLNLTVVGEFKAFESTVTVLSCLPMAAFVRKATSIVSCFPGKMG
jgi:hypothetical protein